MGGIKVQQNVELNEDHLEWLKAMVNQYGLDDENKALRIVLDFVREEGDLDTVFTEVRCLHCG